MDLGLKDKVVIVNGTGPGIGGNEALLFAEEGAKVVVTDIRKDMAENYESKIKALGVESMSVEMNIAKFDEVKAMVDATLKKFGKIDVLVNNAGYADYLPVREITEKSWRRMFDINVKGCFNTIKCVLDTMVAQKWGRIINTSSVVALDGIANHSHYSAAKAAVISFSKSVAKEVAQFGITVNVIAPGLVDNGFTDHIEKGILDFFLDRTLVGRMGQPREVAGLCAWLASDFAGYVTGQVISPNGGFHM